MNGAYKNIQIVIVGLAALAACPLDAAEVRLRSTAGCSGSVVRVADVAEVLGDDARIVAAISEISLCAAPGAGGGRTFTQDEVRQLLALTGVDRKTAIVTGSESVLVTGQANAARIAGPKKPLVASGVRQILFEAEVEANRHPVTRPSAPLQPLPVRDLKADAAEKPVVEKGAAVTVSARTGGVRITTSGKALEDGATGETIGVELADSKQRVLARISGPLAVEVLGSN
jgi:flagella basal body P-ring formation protein FlgA